MTSELLPQPPAGLGLPTFGSPDFAGKLGRSIDADAYKEDMKHRTVDGVMLLVDYLDKAFDELDPDSDISKRCLSELSRICGKNNVLPKSYTTFDLNGYTPSHITLNVKNPQEFYEKAVIWKRLKHDNILPIQRFDINTNQAVNIASDRVYDLPRYIGRRERTEEFPAILSPGELKGHPEAYRVALLYDVARGLCYLHSRDVIHGGLEGRCVYVHGLGRARIADFGIAPIATIVGSGSGQVDTPQRTVPEVLKGGPHTKESDIFSFGMLMIEVFTGKVPTPGLEISKENVLNLRDRREENPADPVALVPEDALFVEPLWGLMKGCLNEDPQSRPRIEKVEEVLSQFPVVPVR